MKRYLHKKRQKFAAVFLSAAVLGFSLTTPLHTEASAKVKQQSELSYGVDYKKIDYTAKNIKGGVDIMEIDVSDAFTEVQMGKADPLDNLATVRKRANSYHKKYNQIVGAVNANFYSVGKKRPVHLISEDNRLVYAGYINKNKNGLINEPIAFGIDRDGKGLIDHYNANLTYTFNGKTRKISHTNRERASDKTNLYTNDYYKSDIDPGGTEVVLKGSGKMELTLGSTLELEVDAIRKEGDKQKTPIDNNSFVLSGHGKGSKNLQNMKVGDRVKINVGMNKKWHGSEFMMAGGPQLVKNGQVDISMNTTSWMAKTQTSRTAVGVDQARNKVFFVTVDTRLGNGMSIPELARLMEDLGADTALNLDGGGSTTMAIRPTNKSALQVVNKLQDGAERGVSGILMAADTEPERIFRDVSYRDDLYEGIQWAKDQGTIAGYEDHTFRPHKGLSRKHGAVMFAKALDLEKGDTNVEKLFTDVPSTHVYAAQISAVGQAGIFKGGKDKRFLPEETLTREQMATTIVQAFGLEGNETKEVDVNLKNVSPSHRESVQILADHGVTTQLDDFRPGEAVTRGQFAVFLQMASKVK